MTLGPNAIIYDPITHRPTPEFIREQAHDHVGYGWSARTGTCGPCWDAMFPEEDDDAPLG